MAADRCYSVAAPLCLVRGRKGMPVESAIQTWDIA